MLTLILPALTSVPAMALPSFVPSSADTQVVTVERDMEPCTEGRCGGWWFKNTATTATDCADDSAAFACYATGIDFQIDTTPEVRDRLLELAERGDIYLEVDVQPADDDMSVLGRLLVVDIVPTTSTVADTLIDLRIQPEVGPSLDQLRRFLP